MPLTTCQVEPLVLALEEARQSGLLDLHWRELATEQAQVPLMPNFQEYYRREARGEFTVLALRVEGVLVGYWAMSIAPGMHYTSCLTSIMDLFYVHPEHRGFGTMMVLGRAVEKECLRRGVQRWFASEKLHLPCGVLFKRLGMNEYEKVHMRWLGN